jgi:hypothetical protein
VADHGKALYQLFVFVSLQAEPEIIIRQLVDGFRNFPSGEPLIFLSCIFLSSQPAIRKENAGKENKSRKWVGYF